MSFIQMQTLQPAAKPLISEGAGRAHGEKAYGYLERYEKSHTAAVSRFNELARLNPEAATRAKAFEELLTGTPMGTEVRDDAIELDKWGPAERELLGALRTVDLLAQRVHGYARDKSLKAATLEKIELPDPHAPADPIGQQQQREVDNIFKLFDQLEKQNPAALAKCLPALVNAIGESANLAPRDQLQVLGYIHKLLRDMLPYAQTV